MESSGIRNWLRLGLSALGGTLFGLSLAAALLTVFATRFLDYRVLSVESGSMAPALERGDIVVIRPSALANIKQSDVIFFRERNTGVPFVHRVAAVQRRTTRMQDPSGTVIGQNTDYNFVTKGDANLAPDGPGVGPAEFRGKAWFYLPTFGLVGSGVPTTWILLGFSGVVGLAWIVYELAQRRGSARKAKKKRAAPRLERPQGGAALEFARARAALASRANRTLDWLIDRADDAIYLVARTFGSARSATVRTFGRAPKARPGKRSARRPYVARGAGAMILLPAAIWVAAVGVMLSDSALANLGPYLPWQHSDTFPGGSARVVGDAAGGGGGGGGGDGGDRVITPCTTPTSTVVVQTPTPPPPAGPPPSGSGTPASATPTTAPRTSTSASGSAAQPVASSSPSVTPVPSSSPAATPTAVPTSTATVTPAALTPCETPTPSPSPSPSPSASPSPSPSPSPAATPTPTTPAVPSAPSPSPSPRAKPDQAASSSATPAPVGPTTPPPASVAPPLGPTTQAAATPSPPPPLR